MRVKKSSDSSSFGVRISTWWRLWTRGVVTSTYWTVAGSDCGIVVDMSLSSWGAYASRKSARTRVKRSVCSICTQWPHLRNACSSALGSRSRAFRLDAANGMTSSS